MHHITPAGLANTAGCRPQKGVCSRTGCPDARAGAAQKAGAHGAARHPYRYGAAAASDAQRPVRTCFPAAVSHPPLAVQATPPVAAALTPPGPTAPVPLPLPMSRGRHSRLPLLPHCSSPPAGSSQTPAAGSSSSSRRRARCSQHCQHCPTACNRMAPGSQGPLMEVPCLCPCLCPVDTPPWQLELAQASQAPSRAAPAAQGAW